MKKVHTGAIKRLVSRLCVEANVKLRPDVLMALKGAVRKERNRKAKGMLSILVENAEIARKKGLPVCQDTGLAAVFIEMGQDVHIVGGSLESAVNDGLCIGSRKGYLRRSVVKSPLVRKNTGTNAPAIIHVDVVPGNAFRVFVMPKGFGSENKSAIEMLNPTAGEEAIKAFIVRTVKAAGPDACPPYVIGVGIGGTFDYAALMSKKSLMRDIAKRSRDKNVARLEKITLKAINDLNIGVMGLGGNVTALAVNIMTAPTHIAGLPVAVNVSCHATRIARGRL